MHQLIERQDLDLLIEYMSDYLAGLPDRRVFPCAKAIEDLANFSGNLPETGIPASKILEKLHKYGSPATVASAGGRYYGFVIGGTLPSALLANCLATAWDQCAGLWALSPVGEKLESIAGTWLKELLNLPMEAAVGFVTGATMANFTALAAARHALLKDLGWNVEAKGLYGAPEIKVVVGEEVHVSVLKALALLGFGSERVTRIPSDQQGRMKVEAFKKLDEGPSIVCLQAGNVNSGATDPLHKLIPLARDQGAWVHIDGAFGLWAAASPKFAGQIQGASLADSWAVDLHKWLNVPYDSGLVICKNPKHLVASMSVNAAYLPQMESQGPYQHTPGMSRRARGVEAYAALLSLGKSGVAELVETCCHWARRFAEDLQHAGYRILNEVTLNQVLVNFGPHTDKIIIALQEEGTIWVGGTTWKGVNAMRISVSNWATDEVDYNRSLEIILSTVKRLESKLQ